MEFKTIFINFIKYVGKSVLASVLITLIGYCFITKTFPPDFGRLKNLYVSFQKLSALSEKIRSDQALKVSSASQVSAEQDPDKLENLLEHRRQTLSLLSEMNLTKTPDKLEPVQNENQTIDQSDPRAVVLSFESYNNLRLQVKELGEENQKLRQELVKIRK